MYYAASPDYANTKAADPFLLSLAEGGFQVEEYARQMYGPGVMIDSKDPEEAFAQTKEALAAGKTVFEGAFVHENLYVRCDMIRPAGEGLELIEIKAKSFDGTKTMAEEMTGRSGIKSGWKAYLWDVAFQARVVSLVFPEREVTPYLLMADKSKKATVDGLYEKFKIVKGGDMRSAIRVDENFDPAAADNLLAMVDVTPVVDAILNGTERTAEGLSFAEAVDTFAAAAARGQRIASEIGIKCKSCEFRVNPGTAAESGAAKSGFHECWEPYLDPADIDAPKPYDIWNNRQAEAQMREGILLACNLSDFSGKGGGSTATETMAAADRKQLQLESIRNPDAGITVRDAALRAAMAEHRYPLHFIDFETSTNPLPHFKGQGPYEQVAFQFSHHILTREGELTHANQFLQTDAGVFPNFEFVRALREALGSAGTIFRYAPHENTVLRQIHRQLGSSREADKAELMAFIDEITQVKGGATGGRNMVDLRTLTMDHYYNPLMEGSNSIKALLPAAIQCSPSVRDRLMQPLSENGIHSLNFDSDWVWLKDGTADPYKSLPPIFTDIDAEALSNYFDEDQQLAEGGAATMAYGKLQYTSIPDEERAQLNKALLRYCELDTLAMAVIYWHLEEMTKGKY